MLEGAIEGRTVSTGCRLGVLCCSPTWRERGEPVASLGEMFNLDGRPPMSADRQGSVPVAFLTLVRASNGGVRGDLQLPHTRIRVGAS